MQSYAERYRVRALRNTDASYAKLFAMIDKDRPIEWTNIPSGANGWWQAQRRWISGGEAAIEEGKWRFATPLLEECIQNAERIEREPERYQCTDQAEYCYPRNRGDNLRALAFSKWLLGRGLDRAMLEVAGECFAEWATVRNHKELKLRDPMVIVSFYRAVRLLLIAGNIARAKELLSKKYTMVLLWDDERQLWLRLIGEHPGVTPATRARCDELFDIVRDPDIHTKPVPGVDLAKYAGVKNLTYGKELMTYGHMLAGGLEHALEFALVRRLYLLQSDPMMTPDVQAVIHDITA